MKTLSRIHTFRHYFKSGVICQTIINLDSIYRSEGDYVPWLYFCRKWTGKPRRSVALENYHWTRFVCQHVADEAGVRIKQRIYVRPHLWETWLFKPNCTPVRSPDI
jgi:hypothetical protein